MYGMRMIDTSREREMCIYTQKRVDLISPFRRIFTLYMNNAEGSRVRIRAGAGPELRQRPLVGPVHATTGRSKSSKNMDIADAARAPFHDIWKRGRKKGYT